MILYYITDRRQFPGDASRHRERLLAKVADAARAAVDYIQLRERDLSIRELERLAREVVEIVGRANGEREMRNPKRETRLLINSRTDIALASGADGVHLRGDDIAASDARALWMQARNSKLEMRNEVFAVSCHTVEEVRLAEAHGADFAVFAPVFEKVAAPRREGVGLKALAEACRSVRMPVLALGGVTLENARVCVEAGAAGIAAIRLFQENDVADVAVSLRELGGSGSLATSPPSG